MVEVRLPALPKITSICGSNSVAFRKAVLTDLDALKKLSDQHKQELGFIVRGALQRSIASEELIVAVSDETAICGFIHYHHRKDAKTTLYSVVVEQDYRRCGIGQRLVDLLLCEARGLGQHLIQLKCPLELEANEFYRNIGFGLAETAPGKLRPLNVWHLILDRGYAVGDEQSKLNE